MAASENSNDEHHSRVFKEAAPFYSNEDFSLIDRSNVPHHVAVIMDGNRRWARQHGLPSMMGHWKGADTLTEVVRAAEELGIKVLTVFSFSTENWSRTQKEIDALMHLFRVYLIEQREPMLRKGVRLNAIGDLSRIPNDVVRELEESISLTAHCKKIDLVLAFNYGGRDDIRRAMVAMLRDYDEGKFAKEALSEQMISSYLDTAAWPDPEMLIRTSGEKRQSNFLLWQLSYTEFYHTDVLWPDFNDRDLLQAVIEYQRRQRRAGG